MKQQSSRLGTEKIPALLVKLSLPAFIGMFVNALYNILDAIFMARGVGTIGLAALSIVFPIQMIISASAATFGVGGASIISRRLGEKRLNEANKVFGHIIWLIIFFSLIVMIAAFLLIEPLLRFFGATDVILPYAKDYLQIILIGSVIFSFAMGTNNVVRSEGNAKLAMNTMLVGTVVKLIITPIFIFGLEMGMRGAALSTIIGQSTSAIWLLKYFLGGGSSLQINWIWKPNFRLVKEIIGIGLPAFVMMSATSLMVVSVNRVLVSYGGEGEIAIFGIINRLLTFSDMPISGIVQGMQPIIGFNHGAGLAERVGRTFKLCAYIATGIAVITWIIIMTIPGLLMNIFTADHEMIKNGSEALRWIFFVTPMIGLPMVASGLYQALGKARKAFMLSMSRRVLFLLPFVFILPHFFGLKGVWLSFSLGDGMAFLLTAIILLKDRKPLFASCRLEEN